MGISILHVDLIVEDAVAFIAIVQNATAIWIILTNLRDSVGISTNAAQIRLSRYGQISNAANTATFRFRGQIRCSRCCRLKYVCHERE